MSTESVKQVIARAITEPEFRKLLFSDSDKALAGMELTSDEILSLKNLTPENFDAAVGELETRLSRAGVDLLLMGNTGDELSRGRKAKTFEKPSDADIAS